MDDANAYTTFYASWHGCLLGSSDGRTHLRAWARRVIAAQLIMVVSEHPIMALFFMLPGFRFSHVQKLLMIYVMLFLQFWGLLLFYGTGNEGPFVMVWAAILDFVHDIAC